MLVPVLAVAYALVARHERPASPRVRSRRRRARADRRRLRDAAPAARAAHVPLGAPAAERRARGVGACAPRSRGAAPARACERLRRLQPLVSLPAWLLTYVVWHLPWIYDFALKHPHSLLHLEHAMYLVAGIALWWPVIHGRYSSGAKARIPLRGVPARLADRARARARAAADLLLLRARSANLGPRAARRPAARRMTMAVEQAVVFFAVFAAIPLTFPRRRERGRSGLRRVARVPSLRSRAAPPSGVIDAR